MKRGDERKLKNQIDLVLKALEDKNLINSLKGVFVLDLDVARFIKNALKYSQRIAEGLIRLDFTLFFYLVLGLFSRRISLSTRTLAVCM